MKILVRLFFISIVIFSYSQANEKYFKDLYDNKLQKLTQESTMFQNEIKNNRQKLSSLKNEYQKNMVRASINWCENKLKVKKEAANKLKSSYEKSKKDTYNSIYQENKKSLESKKDSFQKQANEVKERIQKYINENRDPASYKKWLSDINILIRDTNKEQKDLEAKNDAYQSSLETKKIKLKISTANTSKTTLSSSNINTIVNVKNVSVSNKAKASVGSISIGTKKD